MLETLNTVLRESWERFVLEAVRVLPNLLGALLIVVVGAALGLGAGRATRWLLEGTRADRAAERLGVMTPLRRIGVSSMAALLASLVRWGITLAAFIPALYSLDAQIASDLVRRFLLYLPHLVVAAVLLWAGALLSRFVGRSVLIASVNAGFQSARFLGGAARWATMLVVLAVALEHLGIGRSTVLAAFAILFGGVTLAAALAVGLGSQDFVRRWLAERARDETKPDSQETFHHW